MKNIKRYIFFLKGLFYSTFVIRNLMMLFDKVAVTVLWTLFSKRN